MDIAELGFRADSSQLKTADRDLKNLEKQADRTERQVEELGDSAAKMGGKFRGAGRGLDNTTRQISRTSSAFQSARGNIQNVAFQVGDFATQVGAGTSASIALGQQLPQLLGGFGALGAVMGAVVAVGVPLASSLLGSAESGEKLEDVLGDLVEAVGSYKSAADEALLSSDELTEKFGKQAEAVKASLDIQASLAMQKSLDALDDAADAAGKSLRGVRDAFGALDFGPRPAVARGDLQRLLEPLELAEDEARALVAAMTDLSNAEGPEATAEAARALNEILFDVYGTVEAMPEQFREMAEAASLVDIEAAKILATTEKMGDAFGGVVSEILNAAGAMGDFLRKAQESQSVLDRFGLGKVQNIFDGFAKGLGSAFDMAESRMENLERAAGKNILDLIAVAEGTEGTSLSRGYNTTLGYGAFTDGPQNLIQMTLNEVLQLQKEMLRHPDNTFNSSAVGRYQIVSITLEDLMGQMGLTGNELFSPALQDQMALQLINSRGLDSSNIGDTWEGMRGVDPALTDRAFSNTRYPERQDTSKEIEKTAKAYDRLMGSLDPVVAVMQKFEQAQETINAALEAGEITADEAARAQTMAREQMQDDLQSIEENSRSAYNGIIASADPAAAALMELEKAQRAVAEAFEDGAITADEASQALALAQQRYDDTVASLNKTTDDIGEQAKGDQFEGLRSGIESVSDAIADAIVNGQNLGEALGAVFAQIAADLISSGIQQMLGSLFAPVLGGGGGLFGGLFGGFLASGGRAEAGKGYIVGEDGPEWFEPGANGTVFPADQVAAAVRGDDSMAKLKSIAANPVPSMPVNAPQQGVGRSEMMEVVGAIRDLKLQVISVNDLSQVGRYVETPEGERAILGVLDRNNR